jgi:hypothetical protein
VIVRRVAQALEDRRVFVPVLLATAVLELLLIGLPDTMGDMLEYRRWIRQLAAHGLAGAYWPPQQSPFGEGIEGTWPIDYPPVFPYVLWGIGRGLGWLAPGALLDASLLDSLVRAPLLLAHWLCGVLIAVFVTRHAGESAGRLVLVVHLLNPALVFNTCYWGQSDALVALGLVASVVAVMANRPRLGWGILAVTVLVKPIAAPFLALLALVELRERGWRRMLQCALVALATVLVTLAPFAWLGRARDILREVFLQVDAMPYASVNAHNLWWLVTGGLPWTLADAPLVLGVSYRLAGFLLFGTCLAGILLWLRRAGEPLALPLAAAGTALALFVLNTHMHENHLYAFLPLLALALPASPRLRWIYCIATVTLLANMALHDPYLRQVVGPLVPGPRLLRPPAGPLGPALVEYLTRNGYGYAVDQYRGETVVWRIALAHLGSMVNMALLAAWPMALRVRAASRESPWP